MVKEATLFPLPLPILLHRFTPVEASPQWLGLPDGLCHRHPLRVGAAAGLASALWRSLGRAQTYSSAARSALMFSVTLLRLLNTAEPTTHTSTPTLAAAAIVAILMPPSTWIRM